MSNVYLTLVSDVTADYAGNVANKFKVKPQLRLPGERWKVSIQSAILPRMTLFRNDMKEERRFSMMEMRYKVDGVLAEHKTDVMGADLKVFEKRFMCRNGVEFMNDVKHLLEEKRELKIPTGKKVLDPHFIKMEWKRENGEPELMLHHSDPSTTILINRKLADIMGWLNVDNYNDASVGLNLVFSYPSHTRETSDLPVNVPTNTSATWLELSSKVNWRFINLNKTFADALNLHKRAMTVTAKVTANNETVTQPLGQVYYAPEGRERYMYTPPLEQFHDVETLHWEEVEISVKELDNKLVNFQPDSQCLIRLHFKKD